MIMNLSGSQVLGETSLAAGALHLHNPEGCGGVQVWWGGGQGSRHRALPSLPPAADGHHFSPLLLMEVSDILAGLPDD